MDVPHTQYKSVTPPAAGGVTDANDLESTKLNPDVVTLGGTACRGVAVDATDARSDERLLSDHRAGDALAFAVLVRRYERELFNFLMRFLGDRSSAEDVFQESFLQVHQAVETFDPRRRFRPWLFAIAVNKARDLLRSQARRPTSPLNSTLSVGGGGGGGPTGDGGTFIDLMKSAGPSPGEPLEQREQAERVRAVVARMPVHLREVLLLSYFESFAYKQIGDVLDIPLGTVKSRLHSAVAYFAERWKLQNKDSEPA